MKRAVALLAVVALLSTAGTGVLVWQLSQHNGPRYPEISAYSHGTTVRVGPYQFCPVLDLDNCDFPQMTGELAVDSRNPVQLSVDPAIARAPWLQLRTYEDAEAPVVQEFRPGAAQAVTIPSIDARYGKLTGVVVQLPTLVRDEAGNEFPLPHAEWSVRTQWDPAGEYAESVTDYAP
ncbi:MAG: DUF2771 domain-containing protein [Microbacteriaceae bacterium]